MTRNKCDACGKEYIDGAKFCSECGTPIVNDDCSMETMETAEDAGEEVAEDVSSHPVIQPFMPSDRGADEAEREYCTEQKTASEPNISTQSEDVASDSRPYPVAQPHDSSALAKRAGFVLGTLLKDAKKRLPDLISTFKSSKSMLLVGVVALLVFVLVAAVNCAGSGSDDAREQQITQVVEVEPDPLNWPSKGLAAMLPVPKSAYGYILADSDAEFCAVVSSTSQKDYGAYVAECMDAGFSVDPSTDGYAYTAENEQGYTLNLQYSEQASEMTIECTEPTFEVTVNVDCAENLFFSTYAIKVYVDEAELGVISHGSEDSYALQLPEGIHTIRIEKKDSSDVFGSLDFTVESDRELGFKAHCHSSRIGIDEVVEESATEVVVEEAKQVISEPEAKEQNAEPQAETKPQEETKPEVVEPEVLTVDNCPELAEILSLKDSHSSLYSEFARKYEGRTICFDGRIDYVANHGSYKTRYDVLVSAGDYDANSQSGPSFKFEDVNRYDMGLTADGIYVGMNVYIVAEVESYNSTSGLFFLDPVSIDAR